MVLCILLLIVLTFLSAAFSAPLLVSITLARPIALQYRGRYRLWQRPAQMPFKPSPRSSRQPSWILQPLALQVAPRLPSFPWQAWR
ncbi:MAG: hypothetical protein J3Q66DRAFT_360668, partial [Benniella sp.]